MIIDFTVTNFRSIREEQTFSMHAHLPGSHLTENITYPGGGNIGLLKSAGIYGANASGKSNFLLALYALSYMIVGSYKLNEGDEIPCYEPYLLSEGCKSSPTKFDVEFYVPIKDHDQPLRFRYCVAFTTNQVVEENLFFYPSTQKAMIFDRGPGDSWNEIPFGSLYKGGRKRIPFFANNTYLSKAGNSADTPQLIRDVYNYFRKNFDHLGTGQQIIMAKWYENERTVEMVSSLLSLVDTGISNINIKKNDDQRIDKFLGDIPDDVKRLVLEDRQYKSLFEHLTDTGSKEYFDQSKESTGTRKLFNLAPLIIDTLRNGGVLIMDELDNSMHPFIAELIIKLFNDSRINKGNAQLIFSTHNVNLMSSELLRRDQIWFTEKQKGSTTLYSLADFDKKKIKSQSPFNQWYAEGRFGAVPAIDYHGIIALFNLPDDANAKKE